MRKLVISIVVIFFAMAATDVHAQSFLKKVGKAIQSEIKEGVKKEAKKVFNGQKNQTRQEQTAQKKHANAEQPKQSNRSFEAVQLPEHLQKFQQKSVYDPNSPATGKHLNHEWVDLGLPSGVRWSVCNYQSAKAENPGKHFAWAYDSQQAEYSKANNKNFGIQDDDISGNLEYDAVRKLWGRGWRIPTAAEFQELADNCEKEYVLRGNTYGIKFTSRVNGQSIFLPTTGFKEGWDFMNDKTDGLYWTSTSYSDKDNAYIFHFSSSSTGGMSYTERHLGCCIRPVSDKLEEVKYPASGKVAGHEWVDLNLPSGTRWASCNVDAAAPSQPGKLYAWGETAAKTSYTEANSKAFNKELGDISGTEHDVAAVKWGNGWRMPTAKEFSELVQFCNWDYVQLDGRWVVKLTSSLNGECIYLPATGHKEGTKHYEASGCGLYWTSTPDMGNAAAHQYHYGAALGEMGSAYRHNGLAVRPVLSKDEHLDVSASGETNGYKWVDMGMPSGTKWATCNIGASAGEETGEHFPWGEIIPITDSKSKKNNLENVTDAKCFAGNPSYDPATAIWGSGWQTPTEEQFRELIDNCVWEWVTLARRTGYKVTSKINGNWIFLPAAGIMVGRGKSEFDIPYNIDKDGTYWTSSPCKVDHGVTYQSRNVSFDERDSGIRINIGDRFNAYSIRPVTR